MKTNIVMKSIDRNLFGTIIKQDTKNQFLSITDLMTAYSTVRVAKGWSDKRLDDILSSKYNIERIFYILEKQSVIKTEFTAFMQQVEKESLTKVLKSYGMYKTTGARQSKSVMCNPYIWVLIALELNPELYATVVMWLTDSLIINRIASGDNYSKLMTAVSKLPFSSYTEVAEGLNWVVFNKHEANIRNTATEQELDELHKIEDRLTFVIDNGLITDFIDLMNMMRKMHRDKYHPMTNKLK